MQLRVALAKIGIGVSLGFLSSFSNALVDCEDVTYGNDGYMESMENLAKDAKLGGYFNRFHEDAVSSLCKGAGVNMVVADNHGYLERWEVKAINDNLVLDEDLERSVKYLIITQEAVAKKGLTTKRFNQEQGQWVELRDAKCGDDASCLYSWNFKRADKLAAMAGMPKVEHK